MRPLQPLFQNVLPPICHLTSPCCRLGFRSCFACCHPCLPRTWSADAPQYRLACPYSNTGRRSQPTYSKLRCCAIQFVVAFLRPGLSKLHRSLEKNVLLAFHLECTSPPGLCLIFQLKSPY